MKKLFGEINMSWKKVIIFSVLIGIYTGLINQVPFLYDTSFRDLAINFERWFLFALFIILNCEKPLEAAKKTFVFFLISQPLIYLVEVPFLGWSIMSYYRNWIMWTILTFPIAYIGKYCFNKKNILSHLIFIPVLLLFAFSFAGYLNEALFDQMHHLYSSLFCLIVPFIIMFSVFEDKKNRIIFSITYIIILIPFTINIFTNRRTYNPTLKCSSDKMYFDETYKVKIENKKMGEIKIEKIKFNDGSEEYCLNGYFKRTGKTEVILEDKDGNKRYYNLDLKSDTYTFRKINNNN